MYKNVASQSVDLFFVDTATSLPKTGDAANLTAYLNGSALADTSAAEVSSANAPGWYTFTVTQGESNVDKALFTAKSTTGGVVCDGMLVYTRNLPNAAPGAAGGVLIAGTNSATVTFGDGIVISRTTLNGVGLLITGNGNGHGISITGGANAQGVLVTGGGIGVKLVGTNDDALYIAGGNSHHGVYILGGSVNGNAIRAEATAGNSHAIVFQGFGTNDGLFSRGGATGNGIHAVGGVTSGSGFKATATAGSIEFDADIHSLAASGLFAAGSSTTVLVAQAAPAGGSNLVGSLLRITSGAAAGQHGRITAVAGANITIHEVLTAPPANGDSFTIIPASADWIGGDVTVVATVNVSGPGAQEGVYRFMNLTTGLGIADADVWLTQDPQGAVTVWRGHTDTQGDFKPLITPGTVYYFSGQKDGVVDVKNRLFNATAG